MKWLLFFKININQYLPSERTTDFLITFEPDHDLLEKSDTISSNPAALMDFQSFF